MSRFVVVSLGSLLLLLVGLAAAPTAIAGDPCYHGFVVPPQSVGSDTEIKVAPCAFGPTVSYVAVGSTVTFFNGPDFTHLITGANQEWGSRDVELQPSQKVSYRFDKPGIYPYACALHRGMSGTIVVGNPSPPGGADAAAAAATSTSGGGVAASSGTGMSNPDAVRVASAGIVGGLVGGLLVVAVSRRRRTSAPA
jgi:plastocyanin